MTPAERRARIVELAANGYDGASIATDVKLSLRQVRRHLAAPDVRAQLRALEDERLRQITRRLGALGGSAVIVLGQLMADKSTPPAARIAAAGRLLDAMVKLAEYGELAERIAALEARLGPGSAAWTPRVV